MGDRGFNPTPLADILARRSPQAQTRVPWRGRPGEPKPLWAILGEAPPFGWQPPEARDSGLMRVAAARDSAGNGRAPGPGAAADPRKVGEPGLYVTAHPAFGVGPAHTAIEYVPEKGRREWISAGPDFRAGRLVSGVGMLDEAGNPTGERSADRPRNNSTVGRITPPEGMTDAEYWERIKALDEVYRDNVDYDVNPEWQDSYNSNSYTRGLLDATGGVSTAPFDDYVGGNSPLPARYFAPPHLRGTGFPDSLKRQPAPTFRRRP